MGIGFVGNAEYMLENFTGAPRIMDNDHAYIHQKKRYTGFYKATITTGATLQISIKTPKEGYIHYPGIKPSPTADKVDIQIFEGATIDVAGTEIKLTNRSRVGTPPTANVEIKHGTTFSDNGTELEGLREYFPGSTGVGTVRVGGGDDANEEVILDPDTVYRILITNGSSATNIIGLIFNLYEEENG